MQGFSIAEENSGRDATEKLKLIDDVKQNSSFQALKPSLKDANSQKSRTSVKSRSSGGKPKVAIKARIDISGDRSIDMFASEVHSVNGMTANHINLTD